ncbi:MAG TPA: PfkB family carbohydrate kinase [Candidatus Acidoferrales bacterium]|nr:PfkB family carbohydrate kinase [Candidatus Acidoferrales bacterium]
MSADLVRLIEIAESFPRQHILVLADLVADEFVAGEITRVSREAPVLILRHSETTRVPGGGANAANNLADLGAQLTLLGAVGDDPAGHALVDYFRQKGVSVAGIQITRGWTTPTKTRFLAGFSHTARQQVLRVDREPQFPFPETARGRLARRARQLARRSGAVLASDYGFGAVTPALLRSLQLRGMLPVTLDSRYALLEYRGAGVAAATPNEPELEALYHTRIGADRGALERLGRQVLRRLGLRALLVTRGKDGMALFEPKRPVEDIPVFGAPEAVDVTGAGDTVIATFTLALAAGATFLEAARLANYAGGIVVMKRGTATVTQAELLGALRGEITGESAPPASAGALEVGRPSAGRSEGTAPRQR